MQRIQELGKQVIPESTRLEQNRGKDAKTIFYPKKKGDFEKYKKMPHRSDLKGFDQKAQKEPNKKQVFNDLNVGYIERDPERILIESHVTKKLINSVSDKIYDRNSMEIEIKNVWNTDKSLAHLVKNSNRSDWDTLFNLPEMQKIIRDNTFSPAIHQIRKKYNVGEIKAKEIFDGLNSENRVKLLKGVALGRPPTIKTAPRLFKPRLPQITVRTKRGKVFSRSKPQKWTDMQERTLRSYSGENLDNIVRVYNAVFSVKRTKSAISSKLTRLKKK